MSSTEIAQFDPNALRTRVSESVKAQFAALIPDDQWESLVGAEMKAYFSEETSGWEAVEVHTRGYDTSKAALRLTVTPFRAVVWSECAKIVLDKMQQALASDEFKGSLAKAWQNNSTQIVGEMSKRQEEMLKSMLPDISLAFFKSIFENALINSHAQLFQDIQNIKSRVGI